jgi:hypothetical protein
VEEGEGHTIRGASGGRRNQGEASETRAIADRKSPALRYNGRRLQGAN